MRSVRELGNLRLRSGASQRGLERREALCLRSVDPYNAAGMYCFLKKKPEALGMFAKAWEAGFKDGGWARKDPDLALLQGEPELERMYPAPR